MMQLNRLKGGLKIKEKIATMPAPLKTSIIYVICSLLQKGVAFFVIPIYTRMVPSSEYGVYTIYQSWDTILSIFASLNLWTYCFSRGMLKYEKQKEKFMSALVGLSFVLTTVLLIVWLIFKNAFAEFSGLSTGIMIFMFLHFYLRPSYEFWCAKQRFEQSVKKFAISSILITLLTPIASVALILVAKKVPSNLGAALVLGKNIIPYVISIIVMIGIIKNCKSLFNREIWKYALRFNLPLIPHFMSVVILAQSDRIMIGNMCSTSEAAIYGVAYSIASVLLIINTSLIDSITPWMYKKMKRDDFSAIPSVSLISLWVILAVNLMVTMFAPEIIGIMVPPEYMTAIYVIPPIAMSNVFIFLFNLYANVEYYFSETKLVAVASTLSGVANIVLNFLLIPKFGFVAAGYTTLACYVIYSICHYVFMKYVLKKHNSVKSVYNETAMWMTGVFTIGITILIAYLYSYLLVRIAISVVIVGVIFAFRHKLIDIFKSMRKAED